MSALSSTYITPTFNHQFELNSGLIYSVKRGDIYHVETIIQMGGNVNAVDEQGKSALYWALNKACRNSYECKHKFKVLDILIVKGAIFDNKATQLLSQLPIQEVFLAGVVSSFTAEKINSELNAAGRDSSSTISSRMLENTKNYDLTSSETEILLQTNSAQPTTATLSTFFIQPPTATIETGTSSKYSHSSMLTSEATVSTQPPLSVWQSRAEGGAAAVVAAGLLIMGAHKFYNYCYKKYRLLAQQPPENNGLEMIRIGQNP